MKIARARLWRVRFRLREPLATARGAIALREGVLLELEADSGLSGHGEALPLAGFGAESCEQSFEALAALARALLGRALGEVDSLDEVDALLERAEAIAPNAPSARAAVDCALLDLAARAQSVSVASLLARPGSPAARVEVSALVSGDSPAAAARAAEAAARDGYRTLKLKVGAQSLDGDAARVGAVREAVGDEVRIRLDANGAWPEREAERAIARFVPHRIELIEQPVAVRALAALARLSARSPIAIAADEALDAGRAVDEIFEREAARVLVLKPGALGGLRACAKIAARAQARGWDCIASSGLDSALGRAAALQLALALPTTRFAAGLAAGAAFEIDLAPALLASRGELGAPRAPGVGVAPIANRLAHCALGSAFEIGA